MFLASTVHTHVYGHNILSWTTRTIVCLGVMPNLGVSSIWAEAEAITVAVWQGWANSRTYTSCFDYTSDLAWMSEFTETKLGFQQLQWCRVRRMVSEHAQNIVALLWRLSGPQSLVMLYAEMRERIMFPAKAPVTPDRTILWSHDWLRFGQLRPIGNVCCDLLLQSHALVYYLRLVVGHTLICMILYVFIPSGQLEAGLL